MGLASGGRKRIRKSGRKGCLGIYFSISLSFRSQMAGIVSLYLCHTFCWVVPFGQPQILPGPTLLLISGPRMVSASCFWPRPAAQSLVGPLHSAETFSYIFLMCSLLPAKTLDDISPLVGLSCHHLGTCGQSTPLDGPHFFLSEKCWGGKWWSSLWSESPFWFWHPHFYMREPWSIVSSSSSSLLLTVWAVAILSGRWSPNNRFLLLGGSLLEWKNIDFRVRPGFRIRLCHFLTKWPWVHY